MSRSLGANARAEGDQVEERGPQTLSATVYARLRQEIVDGTLAPGGKLRIGVVSARYGVTSTPVREALSQLASEGFVRRWEQRGFTVAAATEPELQELTRTRCWVEEVALRQAMLHATPAWEEGVVLALHRLSRTPRSLEATTFQENPAWEAVHRAFHMALLATCPSGYLRNFCAQLSDHATRYRRLAMNAVFPARDIGAEHRAIADAALSADADTAVDVLTTHYRRTASIVAGAQASQAARNS
jgi:GntR family carbon starvation induced transcriptional regulator